MGFDAAGRIRQLLTERGWSIYRLAEQAHIPQSTLSNMFSRGNQPSLATLELICDALGITLAQFFAVGGEETALSARQQAVLSAWDGLSPSQQEALLQLLDTMHPQKMTQRIIPLRCFFENFLFIRKFFLAKKRILRNFLVY